MVFLNTTLPHWFLWGDPWIIAVALSHNIDTVPNLWCIVQPGCLSNWDRIGRHPLGWCRPGHHTCPGSRSYSRCWGTYWWQGRLCPGNRWFHTSHLLDSLWTALQTAAAGHLPGVRIYTRGSLRLGSPRLWSDRKFGHFEAGGYDVYGYPQDVDH